MEIFLDWLFNEIHCFVTEVNVGSSFAKQIFNTEIETGQTSFDWKTIK
jgi:hypothetical protein